MGNAGRNGGEYYTPRAIIRAMLKVTDPRIGETVYDGACGSAGFLCEAFEYLNTGTLSGTEWETLQRRTLYGQEKKTLPYVIGVMNMILHGVEAPNIAHANTLTERVMDIGEGDRHDVVLANPPFGGDERAEVQHNFPIQPIIDPDEVRELHAKGMRTVAIAQKLGISRSTVWRALKI